MQTSSRSKTAAARPPPRRREGRCRTGSQEEARQEVEVRLVVQGAQAASAWVVRRAQAAASHPLQTEEDRWGGVHPEVRPEVPGAQAALA